MKSNWTTNVYLIARLFEYRKKFLSSNRSLSSIHSSHISILKKERKNIVKTYQLLFVLGVILIVAIGIATQIHQLQGMLTNIRDFIVNLLVFVLTLAGSGFLGWLIKAYGIAALDTKVWPEKNMTANYRYVILFGLLLVVFFGWIWVAMALIVPGSWVYAMGRSGFDWSGAFETPPVLWGVWGAASFLIAWAFTDHRPGYRLFNGEVD